jgi:hypothetical protein
MRYNIPAPSHPGLRALSIVLASILCALVFSYIGFSIWLVQSDYAQEEVKGDIARIQQEGLQLQVQLSERASLEAILARTENLAYTEIEAVHYIKKPSHSPFAAR